MNVSDALCQRFTCRAFLDTPVSRKTVERLLTLAGRSPSAGNIQPWRVWALAGEELAKLKAIVGAKIEAGQIFGGAPDYVIYPPDLQEPYLTRRFQNGERWYRSLNIDRDDFAARTKQVTANFSFFGAPVGLIVAIERNMLQGQWADLGIFLQSLMLAAKEEGLDTAPLASWSFWSETVHAFLDMPESCLIYCGVALGHADPSAPVNKVRQERAPLAEIATLRGF